MCKNSAFQFFAGILFTVVVLLAGYGLHALQDDVARIKQGRAATIVLQDILNDLVPK